MLTPGFKTGPRNWAEGREIVEQEGAQLGEIWFNVLELEQYKPELAWFTERDVQLGLHHWGLVGSCYKPTLVTNHEALRQETIDQVKQTIDFGREISCAYVNAHPGARLIEEVDFTVDQQSLAAGLEPTPPEQAQQRLEEAAHELSAYAREREVVLTFETVPARERPDWSRRDQEVYDSGNTRLPELLSIANQGSLIGNDISHTAAHAAVENPERDFMWREVMQRSKELASQTRLLHINTMSEPFNGTDSHDGITDDDFANDVFPNREQLKDWLRLFNDFDHEIFAVLEPSTNMRGNYQALVKMLEEL